MRNEQRGVLDRSALQDPYEYFAGLREDDPVHWSEPDGAWILTRREDVQAGFRDGRLSSERIGPSERHLTPEQREGLATTLSILDGWMAFRDEPEHGRLRAPLRRTFTPKRVRSLNTWVEKIVLDLLDDIDTSQPFDLVSNFSFPLPAIVIAELLGVPPEDREEFKWWSNKLATLVLGTLGRPDVYERARDAGDDFLDYFTGLIRRYEKEPEDNLISALIAARKEGYVLSDTEMVGACTLLLFGGHETTANLITNGTLALIRHPEQLERVRQQPEFPSSAVEEALRYDGPAKIMERRVVEPIELHGKRLQPGDHVYLAISSANRDPDFYDDPDTFDVMRDPNPHLGFGHGNHFCLGAPLARLEAQIALSQIFNHLGDLEVVDDELEYSPVVLGRSLPRLTVSTVG